MHRGADRGGGDESRRRGRGGVNEDRAEDVVLVVWCCVAGFDGWIGRFVEAGKGEAWAWLIFRFGPARIFFLLGAAPIRYRAG